MFARRRVDIVTRVILTKSLILQEMEKWQKLRPVEFKNGILWLEESPRDFEEDCLEFSHKDSVFVKDFHQKLLVFTGKESCGEAKFRDLNKIEKADAMRPDNLVNGIKFDVIYHELTNCKTCGFKDSFPVSFVVHYNSKTYQMSCSESKCIEFLEQNTTEEEIVDRSKRNIIFYRKALEGQFSMFESELARGYWLCAEHEKGLYKLALKEVKVDVDEGTLLRLSLCK
ncbi:uncharacterized protein LOC122540580 isoform X1 [Chiloscyllium plagiosum]|uniref:uncharacterized protein LOC122540580 isoform X1 n=1 Tax=Chiloscyllium plagiosum TaxID=36176 RepID=UPI001CB7C778|nr:uncharacterized protein LOC122540580 isoform X1 [Chiloscyllium plagiosum]